MNVLGFAMIAIIEKGADAHRRDNSIVFTDFKLHEITDNDCALLTATAR